MKISEKEKNDTSITDKDFDALMKALLSVPPPASPKPKKKKLSEKKK